MEKSSHMLKVGEFVLNTDSRKLYDKDKKEVALAPTLFSLLKFFIDHQNQTCSKDMIIDNVWKGKIVVEANVNQNIKKLRDVLGDSANDPRYIETVTGEGFRFVANSEEYKSSPREKVTTLNVYVLTLSGVLLLLTFFTFYLLNSDVDDSKIRELHPISTLRGLESYPNLSRDKKFVFFNHKRKGSWDIYYKPIDKESYNPLLESDKNEWFPAISPDQKRLLFHISGAESCGLYILHIDIENKVKGDIETLLACEGPSERLKAVWKSDTEIFISKNQDFNSAANIYLYDLNTKKQRLISKPDIKGFGDYTMKYNPEVEKLAYVRDIGWSTSEIWVYDLNTKQHQKIKSTSILLSDIDWLDNNNIVFRSGNKRLSKINIESGNEELLGKFSSNINSPFAINSEYVGVQSGSSSVIDIGKYDIESGKLSVYISSSSNDYFAAKGADYTAFVSNRTGEPQVWLRDIDGSDNQLTYFKESSNIGSVSISRMYNLIIFSRSGHVIVLDREGREIFNSENYSNYTHKNPVIDEKNKRILYSVQYNGNWNIESRGLDDLSKKTKLFSGISARPCSTENCILFMKDNDPFLYRYYPENNTSVKEFETGVLGDIEQWAVLDNDEVFYLKSNTPLNQVSKVNLNSKTSEAIFETKAKAFTLDEASNTIFINIVSQGNTDLMYFEP